MSSMSPDKAPYENDEEHKRELFDEEASSDNNNYDFLATASLMKSQGSPQHEHFHRYTSLQETKDVPQLYSDINMNTAEKPKKHKFKVQQQEDDLNIYLMHNSDVPFKEDDVAPQDNGKVINIGVPSQ